MTQISSLLIPGQTYTLAETAAPTGYQPLAGSALFAHLAIRAKKKSRRAYGTVDADNRHDGSAPASALPARKAKKP